MVKAKRKRPRPGGLKEEGRERKDARGNEKQTAFARLACNDIPLAVTSRIDSKLLVYDLVLLPARVPDGCTEVQNVTETSTPSVMQLVLDRTGRRRIGFGPNMHLRQICPIQFKSDAESTVCSF